MVYVSILFIFLYTNDDNAELRHGSKYLRSLLHGSLYVIFLRIIRRNRATNHKPRVLQCWTEVTEEGACVTKDVVRFNTIQLAQTTTTGAGSIYYTMSSSQGASSSIRPSERTAAASSGGSTEAGGIFRRRFPKLTATFERYQSSRVGRIGATAWARRRPIFFGLAITYGVVNYALIRSEAM